MDREIGFVAFDSRQVDADALFVALRGTQTDGHRYIDAAVKQGAVAVVCETLPETPAGEVTFVQVQDSAMALATIAANFYDNPSAKLNLVGITGTNGKTTTATLLYNLFQKAGKKSGLLSTVENRIDTETLSSTHTTGDALQINEMLHRMVQAGCEYCFMEVSSHALHQHRVHGLQFAGAVFTNLTRDHLDYHETFEAYLSAKKMLFDMLSQNAFALTNADEKTGRVMLQNSKAAHHTYAIRTMADFKAKIIENQFNGLHLSIEGTEIYSRLVGRFNAYNLLAVYGTAVLLGMEKLLALTLLSTLDSAPGRFQYIRSSDNITAIVDYAHTPDALQKVLKTVDEIRNRNEQVITVIGCGGNRDKGKRPQMARIAAEHSDRVIFTADNPRNEPPELIIADMQEGVPALHFKKTLTIENRREAIKTACALAQSGDIILVAGKGHETYQEIQGKKYPFDDMQVLRETLNLTHD